MELGGFIQFTLEAVGLEDMIQILSVLLVVAAKTFRTATVEQVAPIVAREVWKAEYGLDSECRADWIAVAEEYKSVLNKLNLF